MANESSSSTIPTRLRRIISVLGPTRLIAILAVTALIIAAAIAAGVRSRTEVTDLAVSPGSAASSSTEQTTAPTSVETSAEPGRDDKPEPVLSESETRSIEQAKDELNIASTPATTSQPDVTVAGKASEFAKETLVELPTADRTLSDRPTGLSFERAQMGGRDDDDNKSSQTQKQTGLGKARVDTMRRAKPWDGDLRLLPFVKEPMRDRPEREGPRPNPGIAPGTVETSTVDSGTPQNDVQDLAPAAPAPTPTANFAGLDNATFGAGHPPDTNGDVGPTYYIQTINTAIGIYDKSSGTRVAAFTFNTFMSQGQFGNICDTQNFGDPVVLYDTFEDRWVISDFAFQVDASGNVSPQVSLQCFAVSKTGNPVSGGWNYYWINTTGGLGDYPKLGIWPDGLYMSVNMFDYAAAGSFQNARVYALNKAQMYAGAPTVQTVSFDLPSDQFTVLPANARLQTGTPPAGSPNYMATVWNFLNSMQIWKFKVDWSLPGSSAITGPFDSTMAFWWEQWSGTTAPTPKNGNDTLYPRLMVQNQYSNIAGVESIWNSHSVGAGNPTSNLSSAQSAVRYYQTAVTGGTVSANTTQSFTYSPDTTVHRYMPSAAVDRLGDLAIGYTTSNATTNPALKYAGRLAGDPVNSITQTEQTLIQGTGAQTGNCGPLCTRWGDYSAMTLDPDGCTFWYTNEYYNTNDLNHITRIGSFKLNPACTAVGTGSISGQVTANPGGAPISGATVALGIRTTTTDASGNYSLTGLPQGTYPTITASYPGKISSSATGVVVTNGGTTTQNFSLSAAATSGCIVDTSLADFQAGTATSTLNLNSSPGSISLVNTANLDQQQTTDSSGSGFGFTNTTWYSQTFTAGATGQLTRVDLNFFSLNCSAVTMPSVTVSVRNAASNLPTGADLASATVSGFCNGGGGYLAINFSSPITVTSGTQYALVWRAAAAIPSPGAYYGLVSSANPYAGGRRASSSNSGSSWSGASGNTNNDFIFRTYVNSGYSPSGDFTSGVKDANPVSGGNPTWGTLSWTATTPASTAVKFQAAASNNPAGPFSFVGPDGTASTFFTTTSSLSQFNGSRYLKYKALLSSSNSANTPSLADVSICFVDQAPTSLAVDSASGTFGGTVNLSATLTSGGSGVSGKTVDFKLNNISVGSGVTNVSGVATLANASLAGISVGNYPAGVAASFGGDGSYLSSTATNSVSVAAPLYNVSGKVVYGTTPVSDPVVNVSGVTLSATGSPSVADAVSAGDGTYSMSGFGSGAYTVTPSRSPQVTNTGITLQDASEVAKYAFHQVTPTANQTIASDATGDGTVSLQDASEIAKRSFNIASTNVVGTWKFAPANRQYSGLAANQTGMDYAAIMVGDVTGNWTAPGLPEMPEPEIPVDQPRERSLAVSDNSLPATDVSSANAGMPNSPAVTINVSLPPNASGSANTTVLIPVTVGDMTGQNITSYDMTVSYDSNILQPSSTPYDTASTRTGDAGYSVFVDPTKPAGQLRVGAFGFLGPLAGQGTLIYLKFDVKPGGGAIIPLTFVQFIFGEGKPTDPAPAITNGQFTRLAPTGADVSVSGRVLSAFGYGVQGASISVTGTASGVRTQTITGPMGYFDIQGLNAGETYVITVESKWYTFAQPAKVMTLNDSAVDLIFTANP